MVKLIEKDNASTLLSTGKKLYQCEECGLHYENKETAEKCENWCREHKSCNLDIIKEAVENKSQSAKN